MSRRTEMLGSTIQRELAEVIQRDLTDPRLVGLPSITRVKVASDLSMADVYVTVMGTPGQQTAALHALQHSAGLMRTKLTRSLSLRMAPFLRFHIDENLRREIAVLDLIRLANEERAAREAAAAPPAEEVTTDEASAEEASAEGASAEGASAGGASAGGASAGGASAGMAADRSQDAPPVANEPGQTE